MKKHVLKIGFAALAAISLLSSCASNFSLTKRRYSPGYQVQLNLFGKDKHKSTAQARPQSRREVLPPLNTQKPEPSKIAIAPIAAAPVSFKAAKPALSTPVTLKRESRPVHAMQQAQPAKGARILTPLASEKKSLKRPLATSRNIEDSTLLYLIIAFFIPFLGVLLYEGEITSHFWISLLLTLLFWLPGFIYAVLVILGEI